MNFLFYSFNSVLKYLMYLCCQKLKKLIIRNNRK